MVKVVENGERICTVTLDGSESSVVFQNDYKYFAVKNESDAAVYVSLNRDIIEGADGVMTISSKESALFAHMKPHVNMFFVKGTGKIQVFASSTPINPFKSAPVAGSGGGGANIQPLSVIENKEYNAADYGCDGFDPVVVNVGGTTIDGTIYNPNDTDKNYPIDDPTIINATDINDVIGGTVISPGEVVTVTGIDGNADCALRIYIRDNKLRVQTVNLVTGETSESYSLHNIGTGTATVTGIKFESNASGVTHRVIVSYAITHESGDQYGGNISQQAANAHGHSYGTAVAVTSGVLS